MAKQTINIGTGPNTKTGDPLRTAFTKINENFTELYTADTTNQLGKFKIWENTLGTTDDADGWGSYDVVLSPNGEGSAWIYIPKEANVDAGEALEIGNYNTSGGGVKLRAHTYDWTFKPNGTLYSPILTVNLHNGGDQNGQVLQFGNPDQQVIITGPTPAENVSAQRLIIQGQKATGNGEGGDVYFWAGDSQVNGGDIKIYAGDADGGDSGYGGYINIDAGNGYNAGGSVSISAGGSTTNGGDVTLSAGYGGSLNGRIILNTSNYSWTISNDASLQLPPNGTIKDSNGNILVSSSTFVDLPVWLTAVAATEHLPTLNRDYGWDSNGVWFTNNTIGNRMGEGVSYPIRLATPISATDGVVITVDFDADPFSNDFGIGVWETGTDPVWSWMGLTGGNRIGAQYNGTGPELYAIAGTGVGGEGRYDLPTPGTYRARLTITPPADGAILVTLETLDTSNNVLDTISYTEQPFSSSYTIGFASDQDNGTDKTYMRNLVVNVNNGAIYYSDNLTSYSSIGTTGTGAFSFADNTVTVTSEDMRFRTTRAGFDVDCDFDVEAADDVFIDALGDEVAITAANIVSITTGTSEMYRDVFYGQEDQFVGTWNGTTLTITVPNGQTDLITLLDQYQNNARSIWLKTAIGYTETTNNDPASKTPGEFTTVFEIPLAATSPVPNADVLRMKLYDSINNGSNNYRWEFTKNGRLQAPNGGGLESVGMGWIGLTNGTTGNPVSVVAKNTAGIVKSSLDVFNSNNYGTVQINTNFAPGSPDPGNYNTASSTGGWDVVPLTGLSTTGGSGYGLTVDAHHSGSGYIDYVTVVNGGNSYVNGETITVTSGGASATFVITVPEYYYNWTFNELGRLILPTDGDIKNTDGISVIKAIPQNYQSDYSDYTLVRSDAGKHIYKDDGDGYGVVVPTNANVEYDIGTAITIVSGNGWTYIYPADGNTTQIWGAGYNQYNQAWYIPNNSMATLLKIGQDKWMLSGAGLSID